jgi:hypothetical protein
MPEELPKLSSGDAALTFCNVGNNGVAALRV